MLFPNNNSLCEKKAKVIVCSERGKKYRAYNQNLNTVYKYRIDGDIIPSTSSSSKCDYLVENEDKKRAYLIELKGRDLAHAFEQLESTICFLSPLLNSNDYTYALRVVCHNATHGVNGKKYRNFRTKHKDLVVKSDILEENI